MTPNFTIGIVRVLFVTLSFLLGISISLTYGSSALVGALAGTGFGLTIVALDLLLKNFTIRAFSSATFGLLVGIVCAWLLLRVAIHATISIGRYFIGGGLIFYRYLALYTLKKAK